MSNWRPLFAVAVLASMTTSHAEAQNAPALPAPLGGTTFTQQFTPDQLQFTDNLVTLQLQAPAPTISSDQLAQGLGTKLQLGNWKMLQPQPAAEAAAEVSESFEPLIRLQPYEAPVFEAEVLAGVKGLSPLSPAWRENVEDLRRAHQMGNLDATALLGEALLKGRGITRDTETGLLLLNQAIAAGVPRAFTTRGTFLLETAGDNQLQRQEAVRLLENGLERGDANAALPLALDDLNRPGATENRALADQAIQRLTISSQFGTGPVPEAATRRLSRFCDDQYYVCVPLNVAIAVARQVQLSDDNRVQTFTDRHSLDYAPFFTSAVATFPLRKDDAPPTFPGIGWGHFGAEPIPQVNNDLSTYAGGEIERADFFAEAKAVLEQNPGERILLYVHGFNNSVEDALTGIVRLKLDGELPGIPMLYSWAAGKDLLRPNFNNPLRPAYDGYGHDIQIAASSCQQFRSFLLDLAKAVTPEKVILFGHSHGARLIHAALTDCEFRGELPEAFPGKFDNVIYAAPDIDTDQFLQSFQQLGAVASKVTVYASDKDFALDASANFARGGLPRLGIGGANMTVVAGIDSVDGSTLPGIGDTEFGHAYAFLDETVMSDARATLDATAQHPCRTGDAAMGFRLLSGCL